MLDASIGLLEAGLAVIPAKLPDKRPAIGAWKTYQSRLPTATEVQGWFAKGVEACCLVCGAVSGNLELLDFDCAGEAFTAWSELVATEAPGLLDRLVVETSPSGGWHVAYRCTQALSGNAKLASRRERVPGPQEVQRFGKTVKPRKDHMGQWQVPLTLIETRGEGGLFLCAPTPGYILVQGDFSALPLIDGQERELLWRCARALNEVLPEPLDGQVSGNTGQLRPGDDFARRADIPALLMQHGWTLVRDGENQHWCRPGKMGSTSATLRDGVFYVFSSSADPFEPDRAYSPFAVYALLEHGGHFQEAATELRRLGFGEPLAQADPAVDITGLLATATPPLITFDLQRFSETPERQIDWLWPGVIPRGMVSLIGGKQGLGKSFLICDLAARVASGFPMPDGSVRPPGQVLLLAREDDASCVLLPRLKAAKADLSRVAWSVFASATTHAPLDLTSHIDALVAAVTEHQFELIVVDTFAAFAPVGTDANAAQDVRLLLDSLTRLARTSGAAVVVVAHLRKTGQGDGDPMDAIAGSTQMTAGVRVAALLDKGMQEGERWFRVVKSNLGKINEDGWTWRFAWPDPFTEGAADMPHLEWAAAGEEYRSLGDGSHHASVPPEAVREALLEVLAAGPRSQRSAVALTLAALRRTHAKARKADIELLCEEIFTTQDTAVDVWEGPILGYGMMRCMACPSWTLTGR